MHTRDSLIHTPSHHIWPHNHMTHGRDYAAGHGGQSPGSKSMPSTLEDHDHLFHHPIDTIEQAISQYQWPMDRTSEAEMTVQMPGRWCDYSLFINWSENAHAVQFTCAFDMRVGKERRGPLYELLALANEQLWLGHFTLWGDDGLPMFRHSLPLKGSDGPSHDQIMDVIETALYECERFFPAFQYVIWGGRPAREAVEAAMIETAGEA